MTTTGQIVHVGTTEQVTDKFSKRTVVITDGGTYPQEVAFELHKDKCSLADGFQVGDKVTIEFNLNGRRYENPTKGTQWFNTLQIWKLSKDAPSSNEPF